MFLGFALFFVRLNHVAEYVFIALVVIWVLAKLLTRNFQVRRTFLDWPMLLFLGWILVTSFLAVDPTYSLKEWQKTLPRFLMFWFVVNTMTSEHQVRSVLFASALGVGVLSVLEVTYYFWNGGELLDFSLGWGSRAGDFTGSSQWLGTYVVMGVPIVFLGIWSGSVGRERIAYLVICAALLGAVLLVHTRATWLAVMIEVLVFGLVMMKQLWRVRLVMVMAPLVLVFVFLNVGKLSVLTELQVANPTTLQIRFNTWWFAIEQIANHPVVGVTGIGYGKHSFDKAYPHLGPGFHTHIHNMVLSSAVQLGVPGFMLFTWIFWKILRRSYRELKECTSSYARKLSLAIFLATIGLIVRNIFDDMFIGSVVYLFWLFIGLFYVTISLSSKRSTGVPGSQRLSSHS